MYAELYRYFIKYKELNVPGIGTFLLERKPAVSDFPNKLMNPGVYTVRLQYPAASPAKRFFAWLSHALHISDRDAVVRFNDFAFDMKKQITSGQVINWKGVGILSKGLAGEIKFAPAIKGLLFEEPVKAEKMIREKAEHMVRVGEDERTSAQMEEMLSQPTVKKSYWWAYALVIALLAIMFIGWYFSEHGFDISSTANNKKAVIEEAPATYQVAP